MNINIAVVPVAGLGTRLLPATKSQPKEMLPVGCKPVVQYVVEELARVGMKRFLFITGPGKTSIESEQTLNSFVEIYTQYFGDPTIDEVRPAATTPFLNKPYSIGFRIYK